MPPTVDRVPPDPPPYAAGVRVAALPIRVRHYWGESLSSYAVRLAAANHTCIADLEAALVADGRLIDSTAARHPDRLAVWRALGGLHPAAFTEPTHRSGEWVTDRALCLRCCAGHRCHGLLAGVGWVCLRHRRWLGTPQQQLNRRCDPLAAERRYRSHLAGRDVLVDSYVMRFALELAYLTVPDPERTRRREQTGIEDPRGLVYPEQVGYARLLCHPAFLDPATDPATPPPARQLIIDDALRTVTDQPSWRVTNRVRRLTATLTGIRHQNPPGSPGDGFKAVDEFNLLRLLDPAPAARGPS